MKGTPIQAPIPEGLESHIFFSCVEGSNDAIMLTDIAGKILYVNPAWERLFGFQKSESIGQTPRLLRSGRHPQSFYTSMWKDILDSHQGFWKGEVINRKKSGEEVPVLLTISPFRSQEGITSGYMSVAVDISDKKRMEAQMQWQDRLATIGLLASGLAHELGTPLGVVRGRAEYLLKASTHGSVDYSSLDTIIRQIDRVSTLMQSLLSLGKLSSSEVRMPVPLPRIIEEVTNLIRGKAEALGIDLKCSVPKNSKVLAEAGRLEHALLNLCMDSIQAIETQKSQGKNEGHFVKIQASLQGKFWEIAVSDSGGGVSDDFVPHLFKPFFTTKEVGIGTGLGLATIYQVIQSWGGKVELDNQMGHGATFKITLPRV